MNIPDLIGSVLMFAVAAFIGYLSVVHFKEMSCYGDFKMKFNLFGLAVLLAVMAAGVALIGCLLLLNALAQGAYHVN